MVLSIGVDIVQISRFHKLLTQKGLLSSFANRLAARVLHETHELPGFKQFQQQQNLDHCIRILAGSWAAKEAVFKTLDPQDQKKFHFNQWYRLYENGKPRVYNDEYPKKNEEFLHSASHDGGFLVATVLRQLI